MSRTTRLPASPLRSEDEASFDSAVFKGGGRGSDREGECAPKSIHPKPEREQMGQGSPGHEGAVPFSAWTRKPNSYPFPLWRAVFRINDSWDPDSWEKTMRDERKSLGLSP